MSLKRTLNLVDEIMAYIAVFIAPSFTCLFSEMQYSLKKTLSTYIVFPITKTILHLV